MSTLEPTETAPRKLGHYQLVRETGRGGMSIVYEAMDTRLGRTVALKVLHAPLSSRAGEDEMIARMEREARTVASLSHPNVITIYDVGQEGNVHYLATEFLDGMTLRERLYQGLLPPEQAADILRQVAGGLDAVHRQGVMHRDIKPSNIMLLYNGRVKLLDFGIARFADDSTLTQIGSMVGSPSYMAPELLNGGKASPASDIWALGVVLYEMLSCRLPFEADSMAGVMYHVMYDAPAPLPNTSPEIADVLYQALSKSQPERFPTALALADTFDNAVIAHAAFESRKSVRLEEVTAVQEQVPASYTEEKTVLTPAPVIRTVETPIPVPVRRAVAPPRRSRPVPAVFAFAALASIAVAGFAWRNSSSKPMQRTAPEVAVSRPAAKTKTESDASSAFALGTKTARSPAEIRTGSSAPLAPKKKVARISPIRKSAPKVSTVQPTSVRESEKRNAASSASLPTRKTDLSSRPQEAEPLEITRSNDAKERTREAQNRVRNADLGAEENRSVQTDLRGKLDGWITATNARDVGEQMRYYSPSLSAFYLKRGVSTEAVRAEKTRLFARASGVDIRTGNPQIKISPDGKTATMRFRKQYTIDNGEQSKRGVVLQELRWRRDGDDWKIVSERDLRVLKN